MKQPLTKVIAILLLALFAPACGDTSGGEFNDEELVDWCGEDFPAPRGVSAMGAEEYVLVRFAPVPCAESHRVEASRTAEFGPGGEVLELSDDGLALHRSLSAGEDWHYRVVAVGKGGRERVSETVSATLSPRQVVALFLEMAPEDLDELYSRDPHSDERLPARLFVGAADGPEVAVEGVRFRGSTTRTYARKSFNIELEERPELAEFEDFNFRNPGRSAGNRLVLNAMWTDPTALREALNFAMYAELGLAAPAFYFAEVYLNQTFEGLYIALERIDREALRRWGLNRRRGGFTMVRDESKSNRHRPEISRRSIFGADIDAVTDSDEEAIALLQEVFRYRGEVEDQNWEGLLELIRWARRTPAGVQWAREFEERFDVDAFIDFLAIHVLTHDRDSLDIDYWLYRDEDADGAWLLIPWDKNLTFGAHYYSGFQGQQDFFAYDLDFLPTMGNALVDKFFATPSLNERFERRLVELTREVFDDAWFEAKIDEYAGLVAPSMARVLGPQAFSRHPSQHQGLVGWWPFHVSTLLDFVSLRRSYVLADLGEADGLVDRRRRVVDESGFVVADFRPADGFDGNWSVEMIEDVDEEWAGIGRSWRVAATEPTAGTLTLYWRHSPRESWYGELVVPGHQWYMDAFVLNGAQWERFAARVQPFSNRIDLLLEVEDVVEIRVGY